MAENLEEVGVEAVVKGFPAFVLQLEAMSAAIATTGVASAASAVGIAAFTLALAAVAAIVVAVVAGIALVVAGFAALSLASVSVARSVESAFAGVAKTTNGLTDEFGKMNEAGKEVLDQFRELAKEVPLSLEDLLRIGELAGQLGIAKDALVGFSEVVAGLAVATDLTIEEASLGLARLASIYEITTEDMIGNTERLGSAITFLGNNFATTEPAILNFTKRVAAIAKQFEISQAEVLGFGAAFTSAGVEAQLGATALQNALIAIGKAVAEGGRELEVFAETSGKSAEEFAEAWETDAAGAFVDFIEGLGDAGDDAFRILDEVGLASDRTVRALVPVAAAGDLLRDAIEGANQAWEDNISLTREVEIRYATFDSQMQIFKNTVRDIGLEIGLFLLPALSNLLEIITPIVTAIGQGLVPAFQSIFNALTETLLPALGRLLDALGFDVTNADLTQGIANFGETIAGGIEAFADFVDEVTELVDLYREGGIDSVAEHFGIKIEDVELFVDLGKAVLIAVGAFVALKAAIAIAAAVGGLIIAIGTLGSTFLLAVEAGGGLITILALFAGAVLTPAALIVALVGAIALLIGVIVVFGERALTALKQLVIIGVVLILQFIGALTTGIANMWESIKANTTTAFNDFNQSMETGFGNAARRAGEFIENFKLTIRNMWASIIANTTTAISNFAQSISNWRDKTVESIVFLGVSAVMAVINWWNDMIAALNEKGAEWGVAIGQWIVDMADKLRAGATEWVRAGKAMMDGLLEGLKRNVGKILAFIARLAKRVLDTIKSALGATSPSKEFMDVGEDLMLGLAKGIDMSSKLPQIALDSTAARMISAGGQIANAGAGNGNIDRSFNPTVNANFATPESPADISTTLALMAMLEGAS